MCAILDTNVSGEVFGDNKSGAGQFFLDWLTNAKKNGQLVVGGELLRELEGHQKFKDWFQQALLAGRARRIDDQYVNNEAETLRACGICRSNDEHVLALAKVSGARLLYTNDRALQDDFKNTLIVEGVRGRVYTTLQRGDVRRVHRDLLGRNDLCNV